jgi:hypothetical protein
MFIQLWEQFLCFFHPIGFKKMNYLIFFLLVHFENPVLQTRPNDWRIDANLVAL